MWLMHTRQSAPTLGVNKAVRPVVQRKAQRVLNTRSAAYTQTLPPDSGAAWKNSPA